MRLLSCHIENFGRLQNADFDFTDNPTVIFAQNGWGKSTLAAFLKSMFYGLPDSRIKSAENPRVKYKPWQGGVYGGSLTFEKFGKRYIVKRMFGDGAKGDDCKIYNAVTFLETTDFPAHREELGETLFGVDEKGYEKLAYMPQGSTESRLDGGLQAALLRSRESLDGGEDVERAVAALEAEERELRAKRKPAKGRLDIVDEQISLLEDEIYIAKKAVEKRRQIEEEIEQLDAQLAIQNPAQDGVWKERYAAASAVVEERKLRLQKAAESFGGKTDDEIRRIATLAQARTEKKGVKIAAVTAYLVGGIGAFGCFFPVVPLAICLLVCLVGVALGIVLTAFGARATNIDEEGVKRYFVERENYEAAVQEQTRIASQRVKFDTQAFSVLTERRQALLLEWQALQATAQTLTDKEARLVALKEEKEALEKRAWRLRTARELLIEAKARSAGNYLQPLTERCRAIFQKFYPKKTPVLTAEGEVRLDEAGALREGAYYSAGMRAALSVCMRLALIETLFGKEKPALILDDPFVDMDEENLSLAKSFLAALKEEYQIVYLTCHESRLPIK